ncbi:hypothetical protein C8R47DRAFT_1204490 [Mycena vitilis]|nr:hypothetical protein C8R47DRAFT_1204490 [Mycena vitilis]
MAILKLYGAKGASCTRRTAIILHELKVPFELIEVDVRAGEHKTPEFLEKHPFGQIPYIVYAGHLPLHRGEAPRVGPSADRTQGKLELANFDPSASKGGLQLKMKGLNWPFDQAVIDEQLAILDKKLDGYERILAKHRYVAGDKLTLVDLFHLPYGPLAASGGSDIFSRRPNVSR